jgi:phosphomannomutase
VPDLVNAVGGTPLMERVGHAFIKARMAKEDAIFAGEVSGHYYFKDFYFADSGLVPSLIILEMLSKRKVKLSDMLGELEKKYFISGEINTRIAGEPEDKMKELAETFKDGKIEWLDGVSVTYDDWHFNVRPSNTEPLLRLNLEAMSKDKMEEKRDQVLGIIRA